MSYDPDDLPQGIASNWDAVTAHLRTFGAVSASVIGVSRRDDMTDEATVAARKAAKAAREARAIEAHRRAARKYAARADVKARRKARAAQRKGTT